MCGTAAGRCDDSPRRLLTKSQKATHSSSANEWTMLSFFTCITVAFCAWTMFAKPASFCVVFARSSTLRNSSKSTDAEPSWSTSRIIDATLSRGIGVPSFSIAAESSSTEILPEPSASNDAKTARISVTSSADIRFPWSSGRLKTAPPRGVPITSGMCDARRAAAGGGARFAPAFASTTLLLRRCSISGTASCGGGAGVAGAGGGGGGAA